MFGAIRQVADTLVGKRLQRIDRAGHSGYETWLESRITSVYERTICARLLAMFPLNAIFFVVVGHKKWLRCVFVLFLLLTNTDSFDELHFSGHLDHESSPRVEGAC